MTTTTVTVGTGSPYRTTKMEDCEYSDAPTSFSLRNLNEALTGEYRGGGGGDSAGRDPTTAAGGGVGGGGGGGRGGGAFLVLIIYTT